MDDVTKKNKEKNAKVIYMYPETSKKHKKLKYTCFGLGGGSILGVLLLKALNINDEDNIVTILKYFSKIITFIKNIIENRIFCFLIIVIAIVFCICYCKKSNNSTKIKETFLNLVENEDENSTVTFDDGNKKIQVTIKKEKKTKGTKEDINENIVLFKKEQ